MPNGILISFTHMPTKGRFKIKSITFPIYMEAITPQKTSGCSVIRNGPGVIPCTNSAAKIIAIDA
jgi:hypothetical protein